MLNRGLSREQARNRLRFKAFAWSDLTQLMRGVHPDLAGSAGAMPSRVNRTASIRKAFNIYWAALQGKTGNVVGMDRIAVNILREFGDRTARRKAPVQPAAVVDESLVDIGP